MFGKEIKVFPKNSSMKKRDYQLLHISPVGHTHTHTCSSEKWVKWIDEKFGCQQKEEEINQQNQTLSKCASVKSNDTIKLKKEPGLT